MFATIKIYVNDMPLMFPGDKNKINFVYAFPADILLSLSGGSFVSNQNNNNHGNSTINRKQPNSIKLRTII